MDPLVVYLFGAGASAQAIEPVGGFKDLVDRVQYWFQNDGKNGLQNEVIAYFKKAIEFVGTGLRNYQTPDTYAKLLYMNNQTDKLAVLRSGIDACISIQELAAIRSNQRILDLRADKRYLNWLLGITAKVTGGASLPDGIGVLTWNYDTGVENAIATVYRDPKRASSHLVEGDSFTPLPRFPIVHLNGNASTPIEAVNVKMNQPTRDIDARNTLAQIFERIDDDEYSPIRFAWDEHGRATVNAASHVIRSARTLVVIGYSFPNFNAEIDIQLLNAARGLKHIYVQTHEAEATRNVANSIRLRAQSAGKDTTDPNGDRYVEIHELTNKAMFELPPEVIDLLWREWE